MPIRLPDSAFPESAMSTADLLAAGAPRSRLRHPRLLRPTRSLRSLTPLTTVQERAAGFAAVLPDDIAFSHVTAALLHGLPLPTALETAERLDVMRETGRPRIRRAGCTGHRGLEHRSTIDRAGLRVVTAADTWCDLGEVLDRGLTRTDLVVAADHLVARDAGALATLRTTLDGRVRPRGASTLREALLLARPGVRSPMESRARVMFVDAGFPEPEVNAVVHDRAGGWLLEGDLVWRAQRVVGEYQGKEHASRRARSLDAQRGGLAADEGWTVLEIFAEDVYSRARRVTLLLRFARELGLDPRSLDIG